MVLSQLWAVDDWKTLFFIFESYGTYSAQGHRRRQERRIGEDRLSKVYIATKYSPGYPLNVGLRSAKYRCFMASSAETL